MKADVIAYVKNTLGVQDAEIPEFLDSFLASFRPCADALRAMRDAPTEDGIRRVTHTLYGFSQNIGASDIYDAAVRLNAAAKAHDAAGCTAGIDAVLDLYDKYKAEISSAD